MPINPFLIAFAFFALSTPAFAEQWEEVFPEKNSGNYKYYFDKNVVALGKDSVRTQYMIVLPEPKPVSAKRAESPLHDKAIYRAAISCKNYSWKFLHHTYYLKNAVQFDEDANGNPSPPPPAGSAPLLISEKVCASSR